MQVSDSRRANCMSTTRCQIASSTTTMRSPSNLISHHKHNKRDDYAITTKHQAKSIRKPFILFVVLTSALLIQRCARCYGANLLSDWPAYNKTVGLSKTTTSGDSVKTNRLGEFDFVADSDSGFEDSSEVVPLESAASNTNSGRSGNNDHNYGNNSSEFADHNGHQSIVDLPSPSSSSSLMDNNYRPKPNNSHTTKVHRPSVGQDTNLKKAESVVTKAPSLAPTKLAKLKMLTQQKQIGSNSKTSLVTAEPQAQPMSGWTSQVQIEHKISQAGVSANTLKVDDGSTIKQHNSTRGRIVQRDLTNSLPNTVKSNSSHLDAQPSMNSIVRSGPLLSLNESLNGGHRRPFDQQAMGSFAQTGFVAPSFSNFVAQVEQPQSAASYIHSILAASRNQQATGSAMQPMTTNTKPLIEPLIATANSMRPSHMLPNPQQYMPSVAASDSTGYRSSVPDSYESRERDREAMMGSSDGQYTTSNSNQNNNLRNQADDSRNSQAAPSDDHLQPLRSNANANQQPSGNANTNGNMQTDTNMNYARHQQQHPELKAREGSGDLSNFAPRNPIDSSYEGDIAAGLSPAEFERDLADLDEELNARQHNFRRPDNSFMMAAAPSEHFESPTGLSTPMRARYRPLTPSFDYTNDYYATANSLGMAGALARPYRTGSGAILTPWHSRLPGVGYSEASAPAGDIAWLESGFDSGAFGPSNAHAIMSPSQQWNSALARLQARPIYLTTANQFRAPSMQASSPYHQMLSSASEHSAYGLLPSIASMPTETFSFSLSPLAAAAAAAAASAIASERDKSRNHHPQQGHQQQQSQQSQLQTGANMNLNAPTGWLAIPRLATSGLSAAPTQPAPATATLHAAPLYHTRPASAAPSFAPLNSIPVYAIQAPRPAMAAAGTASSVASVHPGQLTGAAGPFLPTYFPAMPVTTLLAYRPATSFAYPIRVPLPTVARPPSAMAANGSSHDARKKFGRTSSRFWPLPFWA